MKLVKFSLHILIYREEEILSVLFLTFLPSKIDFCLKILQTKESKRKHRCGKAKPVAHSLQCS